MTERHMGYVTERHMGYVVHLDDDIREDDAQEIVAAIKMIKFVSDVTPVTLDFAADVIAVRRRDTLWTERLQALLREMPHEYIRGRKDD